MKEELHDPLARQPYVPPKKRRKIDEVSGSDIPAVSRRMGEQAIIEEFREKIEKQLSKDKS
jgi:hypothetical protein